VFASVLAPFRISSEEPQRAPLGEAEVVKLLGAGVSAARVGTLVRRFGIDFPVEPALDVLRAAGADEGLVEVLRSTVAAAPTAPGSLGKPTALGTPGRPTAGPLTPQASPRPSAATRHEPAPRSPHPLEPDAVLVHGPHGDLYFARHEVTAGAYVAYCRRAGHVPPPQLSFGEKSSQFPVINVSWQDAVAYGKWLSLETGLQYRLPTEAEWEFAASGGVPRSKYPWGDDDPPTHACFGRGTLCKVGSFKANWGLYDMAGNVAEWVEDRPASKGKESEEHLVKGGSWDTPLEKPFLLEIAHSEHADGRKGRNDIGFRLVRQP
jgi:formylglycine-generating enzyme required for sulfatase activity